MSTTSHQNSRNAPSWARLALIFAAWATFIVFFSTATGDCLSGSLKNGRCTLF